MESHEDQGGLGWPYLYRSAIVAEAGFDYYGIEMGENIAEKHKQCQEYSSQELQVLDHTSGPIHCRRHGCTGYGQPHYGEHGEFEHLMGHPKFTFFNNDVSNFVHVPENWTTSSTLPHRPLLSIT